MTLGRLHPGMTLLFLVWFGLSNTLLASGLVVCRDGHGNGRIEFGCSRNASGECVTSCGDGVGADCDSGAPHPCDDTPIQGDHQVTKAPRAQSSTSVAAPVLATTLIWWTDVSGPIRVSWSSARPERPPDSIRHLRTVVLIV